MGQALKVVLLLPGFLLAAAAVPRVASAEPPDSILKIYATQLASNYGTPWKAGTPHSISGSGFVIPGRRILTNAHVVSDATFIQVRRYGDSERVPARVLHVSDAADLALLTVDVPGFFDGLPALDLGGLPELRQEILVLGFPVGGDTLSVTRGVVSRIESQPYAHGEVELLAGQIDSAVNPGNSGGPVLGDGKVVGVVMQVSKEADKIAYMVPTPVVEHFLADVADGRRDGVPEAPIRWQRLEASDLRRKYALPGDETGVLVLDAVPGSAAASVLKAGDILLSVDGRRIGTDGTIELRPRERTAFTFLLQRRQIGEAVPLEVLREGRKVRAELRLDRRLGADSLVRGPLYGERPRFFLYGGLAFCPVTVNYLKAWGDDWWNRAPRHLTALLGRSARFEGEETVVVCSFLQAELNSGYEEIAEDLIVRADGEAVRNVRHLVSIVEARDSGLLVLETHEGKQVVLDRERVRRDGPTILARYQVPRDRSEDLVAASRAVATSIERSSPGYPPVP
ncbi:MAG TPA: serine protease [Vicinamibacteria bacterium]|nr:serine protease [Vicinamibacteria bacterium]